MQIEKDLSEKFIKYLLEHGYPQKSIVTEWKVGNFRVDIAILDTTTKKVMAIYEFKNREIDARMAKVQLLKYVEAIGDYTIPIYVIYNGDNEFGFVVEKVEYTENDLVRKKTIIPNYELIQNSFDSGYVKDKLNKKEKKINEISIICWISVTIASIFLLLDIFNILEMTINRLILIGIIIGSLLFPYLNYIKIFGIEAEHKQKMKNM